MIDWKNVNEELPNNKSEVLVYIDCGSYEPSVGIAFYHTLYKSFNTVGNYIDDDYFYKKDNFEQSASSEDNLFNMRITHWSHINKPKEK